MRLFKVVKHWIPACAGMTITILFSFFLMFHTFSFDTKIGSMLIATKAWSDFGAHIPLIRSFSLGDNFSRLLNGQTPEYPLFPGEPIRYHFLFYAMVGALEKAGLRLDWALNLASALGFFFLMLMIVLVAKNLFKDIRIALLSLVFFLFNGSLSFMRFFQEHPLSPTSFTDIITNNQFPSFAPWGEGDITAFWNLNIYTNQRHLALAFAITLSFILMTLRIATQSRHNELRFGILWGSIIGIFPFFHQPTLLIFAILLGTYFLMLPRARFFLGVTGSLATVLILPQLNLLPKAASTVSWYPGYLIHDSLSPLRFLSYWWQNLGLHGLFIPLGFLLIPRRAKLALLPLFIIFVVANLFKFSIEVAASHKFFNFTLILGNMISAFVMASLIEKRVRLKSRIFASIFSIGRIGVLVGLIGLLTLSGIIDFFAVKNDSKGPLSDIPANEAATWIRDHTFTNAVFLNSSYLFHPASLAGRSIFLGWPYFAWSAGYDTSRRLRIMKAIYESTDLSFVCDELRRERVAYVTVETVNTIPEIHLNPSFWEQNFSLVFASRDQTLAIFEVSSGCPKSGNLRLAP